MLTYICLKIVEILNKLKNNVMNLKSTKFKSLFRIIYYVALVITLISCSKSEMEDTFECDSRPSLEENDFTLSNARLGVDYQQSLKFSGAYCCIDLLDSAKLNDLGLYLEGSGFANNYIIKGTPTKKVTSQRIPIKLTEYSTMCTGQSVLIDIILTVE
jgi:hypothetical protein